MSENKLLLNTSALITKEELLSAITRFSYCNNIKYKLSSALIYNIDLGPENLKTFLQSKDPKKADSFLTALKSLDDIVLNKSISLFHDINQLVIIYRAHNANKKSTRRHHIKGSHRITKRNILKDNSI